MRKFKEQALTPKLCDIFVFVFAFDVVVVVVILAVASAFCNASINFQFFIRTS